MHGVKRDRNQLSAEIKAQRKEKEAKKLSFYKELEGQFFVLQKDESLTVEALEITTHLLRFNPELYTAWNFRRKVLNSLLSADNAERSVSSGKK
jgi:geranylgeranyl transferase type-2 subunit alpha